MKKLAFALVLSFTATTARANGITITVPEDVKVESNSVVYKCGEEQISATYHNAGEISLAELEIKDEVLVAANVISGSGARYAGGIYIWWTKGDTADLYNLLEDPEQEKPLSCKQQ